MEIVEGVKMTRACSVSNDKCLAPAGYQMGGLGGMVGGNDPANCRLTCFACGKPVCSKCSQKIEWYGYGQQIVCKTCRPNLRGEAKWN